MHTKRSSPTTPPRLLLAAFSIAMLGACSTQQPSGASASAGPASASSAAPVAYLQADTGGDSMGAPPKAGHVLEMHVIDGGHDVEPVARCDRISSGSALGGGTERELQVAFCEGDAKNQGEYWLISEPGVVSVRRGPIDGDQQLVLEHRLRDARSRAVAKEEQ